jgi:hypothetical protein
MFSHLQQISTNHRKTGMHRNIMTLRTRKTDCRKKGGLNEKAHYASRADWFVPCILFVIQAHYGTQLSRARADKEVALVNIGSCAMVIIAGKRTG